jgi:hypothetical protein
MSIDFSLSPLLRQRGVRANQEAIKRIIYHGRSQDAAVIIEKNKGFVPGG